MISCVSSFSVSMNRFEYLLDLTVAWYIILVCKQLLFSGHSKVILQLHVGLVVNVVNHVFGAGRVYIILVEYLIHFSKFWELFGDAVDEYIYLFLYFYMVVWKVWWYIFCFFFSLVLMYVLPKTTAFNNILYSCWKYFCLMSYQIIYDWWIVGFVWL